MEPAAKFDENALFEAVQSGDETAFRTLVRYYSPKLYAFALRITKEQGAAEDIVQEAFLKLWTNKASIVNMHIGAWLYKVASNLAYNHLRRAAIEGRIYQTIRYQAASHSEDTEHLLNYRESSLIVQHAVGKLPDQQRLIYRLSREEGLTRDEIASQLKISPNTVKNHLSKALLQIKKHLKRTYSLFSLLC